MKIDTVIPFHQKDSKTITWCVQGIKNHLDVGRILVVCSKECRPLVESAGAIFFDENKVIEGLTVRSFPHKRWSWYFQQILKLGMADWVETDYYLVVDADTVFLKKVNLFNGAGTPSYTTGNEYHKPYFDVFERLLGFHANREYSFTAHHMMYNKNIVREMREKFPDKPWYINIVKYVEPQSPWFSNAQFNEQDTYGHYMKARHPGEFNIRPLKWTNVSLEPSQVLFSRLSKYYDYCSLHAYMRKNRFFLRRLWLRTKFELKMIKKEIGRRRES